MLAALGCGRAMPVIECSDGQVLVNPSLQALANGAGIWKHCPSQEIDFAIVGAGPAGMAAAVYAASEGLSTLMLDRLGPGGQAGGSSRIENFIGFPAGLSGAELATRGVLQMLKFGARIVAPVEVERLIPATIGRRLARAATRLRRGDPLPGDSAGPGRSLAATGSRGRRPLHGRGHLLRLHDGRGRYL